MITGVEASGSICSIEKSSVAINSVLISEDKNFECAVLFHKLIISLYSQYLLPSSENLNDAMRMRNYIDANISRQITVDELASLIFKSRSQAIRIFKKEYGKTPYDYLLESRIKRPVSAVKSSARSECLRRASSLRKVVKSVRSPRRTP